ncbi:MAG: ABC transporter permease subunit [Halobacteriaceae archaeon]
MTLVCPLLRSGAGRPGWLRLAVKDLGDAKRDWVLYWTIGLLGLLGAAGGTTWATLLAEGAGMETLVGALLLLAIFAVPTVVLIASHEQLSGERRSGRIRTTLMLPYTRRELVVGAFVGRAVLGALNVTALVGGAVIAVLLLGEPVPAAAVTGFFITTIGLAITFVGIGVGWSASTSSTTISLVGSLGTYGGAVLWPAGLTLAWRVVGSGPTPPWLDRLGAADPLRAYLDVVTVSASGTLPGPAASGSAAVGLLLMVGWTVVPLVLGVRRLQAADL